MDKGEYSKLNKSWDTQTTTFVLSIVVQLVVLVFSIVTLNMRTVPKLLNLILLLETIVQAIEFVWYGGLALLLWCNEDLSVPVWTRYIDWALTTPVMLLTLLFLIFYFDEPCLSPPDMAQTPRFTLWVIVIIVMDWFMLFLGFLSEFNACKMRDGAGFYAKLLLWLGFVPFALSFVPHIYVLTERYTDLALVAVIVVVILWTIYGVASLAAYNDPKTRNSVFNITVSLPSLRTHDLFTHIAHEPCTLASGFVFQERGGDCSQHHGFGLQRLHKQLHCVENSIMSWSVYARSKKQRVRRFEPTATYDSPSVAISQFDTTGSISYAMDPGKEYDWDAWKKMDGVDKKRLRNRVDAIDVKLYGKLILTVRELIKRVEMHEHKLFGDHMTHRGFGLENRIYVLELKVGIRPSACCKTFVCVTRDQLHLYA